jgi:cell division protein FtsI/penicillin-binding protein 2
MRRWWIGVALPLLVAAGLTPFARRSARASAPGAVTETDDTPSLLHATGLVHNDTPAMPGLDPAKITVEDNGATIPLADKRVAHLSLDPNLQRTASAIMKADHLPESAIVMIDVATGRVLAYASHLEKGDARDLCAEATAPSASVFKVVTGSALVEDASIAPDAKECYSGGEQRIAQQDLIRDPARDKWCTTLGGAMGRSINTVFARLALEKLKPHDVEEMAKKYGYGDALAFDLPVQPSALRIPEDPLNFARTAAGFWNTTLSPILAAELSATVARGGEVARPEIVSSISDADGKTEWTARPNNVVRRATTQETAQAVTTMMEKTISEGTSYRAFHDPRGGAFLPGIPVAGKTGTLTDASQQRYYTWFTGFAPSRPAQGQSQVAIAVLVVNDPVWRVKANIVAREMLRAYFAGQGAQGVTPPTIRDAIAREPHGARHAQSDKE